jgi:hypothetical protein
MTSQLLRVQRLYHATSNEAGARIHIGNWMHCGFGEMFGGAIYFADSEAQARHKSQYGGDALIIADVDLRWALVLDQPAPFMNLDPLRHQGCNSVKSRSSPAAAWEYAVFEPNRIRLVELRGTIPFVSGVSAPPPQPAEPRPVTWAAAPTSARRLEVKRRSSILLTFAGNDVRDRGGAKVFLNLRGEQLREAAGSRVLYTIRGMTLRFGTELRNALNMQGNSIRKGGGGTVLYNMNGNFLRQRSGSSTLLGFSACLTWIQICAALAALGMIPA